MRELDRFQVEAHRWADRQFGEDRPPDGAIMHLAKEVIELAGAPYDVEEYADCLMLVCDGASNAGISMRAVLDAAWNKLDKNRYREWGEPDENGLVEHIRDD